MVPGSARNWIAVNSVNNRTSIKMKTKNMTTLYLRKSISPAAAGRSYLLIGVALACFALSPAARAQLSPPPDGGYPGGTTAEGTNALFSLTSGLYNTAVGDHALYHNTTANSNTAIGFEALFSNTTISGMDGHANTATGFEALFSNTTGGDNTATGFGALARNITGTDNTADGYNALFSNTTGGDNTAVGLNALIDNISGSLNTAIGFEALYHNTGRSNIALGASAGFNLTTGNNNIDIGNGGVALESNTIRIGIEGTQMATYIAGIWLEPVGPNHLPVLIDSNGKLGTTVMSSRRFKKEIKAMENVSEAILALKPVTFYYKDDKADTPQFGLIAEEVAKVNPELVLSDQEGKPYTVRYDAVNAMLLNEFLKEHRTVQEQGQELQKQAATIAKQQKQIEALMEGLQKVSARLELNKPAPQTVLNNQ
jgi:hypothetical protein